MNILVFYPYIPYPIDRGTYQRTFHLLHELSRNHTVDLLALAERGERIEHRGVFEEFCQRVEFVPFEHPRWANMASRLLNDVPTSVLHWRLPHVAEALDKMILGRSYDCIYVCDLVLAQYFVGKYPDMPVYMDRSRVDLQFQQAQLQMMTKGWRARLSARECIHKLKRYERVVAARVAAEVVCGPDDEVFIRQHISKDVAVKVIANGTDIGFFNAENLEEVKRAELPTVIFCGAMDYTPNVDALRWYFDAIHAELHKAMPELQVLIVGRDPIAEVQRYAMLPGVTVTGGVEDVRPYYRQAWLQIVPLRIGGGTRLKIVESMAIGTPVVSTTIGAQGLGLVHDYDILLADTPADFVRQTVRALGDVVLRATLDVNGQKSVHGRLSWSRIGRELSDFLTAHYRSCQLRSGPPVSILGVPFDNVSMRQTLAQIDSMVESRQPHYIATANVDFLVQAQSDVELRRILHDAHLVLCDGTPLLWASRQLGNGLVERVAGSDLVPELLANAERAGHRVFFLGADPEVAAEAVRRVRRKHPMLEIVGTLSPAFKPLLEMDHLGMIRAVRASRPDILLVSFGCPKQEKWIAMHFRSLGVPVCIGVGATIDFLAEHMKRAPVWMRVVGLEWMFRLAQEPRRLAKRYLVDFFGYTRALVKQLLTLRQRVSLTAPIMTIREDAAATVVTLPRSLGAACASHAIFGETLPKVLLLRPVVLDGSEVEAVDSTGLALFCRLLRGLRETGMGLALASPSARLREVMMGQQLMTLVEVCDDVEAARLHVTQLALERPVSHINLDLKGTSTLAWQGEVTAMNAEEIWQITEVLLGTAKARGHGDIEINLSRVRFMDSTGVSLMVRARKRAKALGVNLRFIQPSSVTRNVVQTLRLERHLLDQDDEGDAQRQSLVADPVAGSGARRTQPAHTLSLDS
jgi:polysaccharide biosynthesis protein PslH